MRTLGGIARLPWLPWVTLAFGVSLSLILVLVPSIIDGNYWPLILGLPITMFPLPLIFVNVGSSLNLGAWGTIGESFALCSTGFVLSAIVGIPVLLHHNNVVNSAAMWFIFCSDLLIIATVMSMGVCFGVSAKSRGGGSSYTGM